VILTAGGIAMKSLLFRASGGTFAAIAASATFVVAAQASAQHVDRSGKDVVESLCVSCHGTGAKGAPRIGDNNAWAKRASQGLSSLTQSALHGIRQMPPHGGNPNLSDTEIERAITYMVHQSGGHWTEPISRTSRTPDRTGEQIVRAQCSKCHQTGVGGAPKIGDRDAWIPRVKQGLDGVIRSAIKGHGAMPPRGGMPDLTDPEIRSAVIYMFNYGTVPTKN
jgi:cytochrome c5